MRIWFQRSAVSADQRFQRFRVCVFQHCKGLGIQWRGACGFAESPRQAVCHLACLMADWGALWSSVKKGAADAADVLKSGAEIAGQYTEKAVNETGRMASQARLHAEISLLQDRIELVKRRWGEKSYDAMVSGDMAVVSRHLDVAKAEMESLMLEMAEKRSALAAIERGEDDAGAYPDYAAATGGSAVPVPPMAAFVDPPVVTGTVPSGFPTAVPVGDPLLSPPETPPPQPPTSIPADEHAETV